jgi:WD40 repeat protein
MARILSYPDLEPLFTHEFEDSLHKEFKLHGHTSSCLTVELAPTGKYLATGGSDSIIAIWDTTDWICRRTVTSMVGPVKSLSKFTAACNLARDGGGQVFESSRAVLLTSVWQASPGTVVLSWAAVMKVKIPCLLK